MTSNDPDAGSAARTAAAFATTHWSTVLRAGDSGSPDSTAALERLCRQYWYPLYAYVRHRGYCPEDAQDLTQEFFAAFLQKGYLERADRERGRFRTFLLTSLHHFLGNARERGAAWKRGGREQFVSWEAAELEGRYQVDARSELNPREIFERRWAATLLEEVLERLRRELASDSQGARFDRLKDCLWGKLSAADHARLAVESNLSASAVRVAIHRLRRRFRETLRNQIAQTVEDPAEIDDEIRYLIGVLGR